MDAMTGNRFTSVVLATLVFLSVFAGAFAGSAAAHGHGAEYDASLTDGGLYWQGQTLNYTDTTNLSDGDTVVLRKVTDSGNEFVAEYSADANSSVLVDTKNRQGQYILEDSNGNELASFEVAVQTVSSEVDNSTVYNRDDVSQNSATFTVDSNRATYDVVVREANGSLAVEDLKTIFADESYVIRTDADGNDYFVLTAADNQFSFDGNFSSVDKGEYNFEFVVEDTGVTTTQTVSVADPGDKDASFSQTVYTETAGDVVKVTVNTQNSQTAELQFGNEEYSGYSHNVSVSNIQDGNVTLLFDTSEAGDGDAQSPWSVHPDSDATIAPGASETSLTDALAPYNYDLSVSVDGLEKDLASVELQERNTEGVSTHTLPSSSDADLEAIQNDSTQTDEIANKDYLVVQVEASGLYGNLDDSVTPSDLVQGSAFAQAQGYHITMVDEDPGLNEQPKEFDVSAAQDLIVDAENDTFYLVFDTADLANEDGDMPTVTFNMTQDNAYISSEDEAEAQSANTTVEFVERTFDYNNVNDDGEIEVTNSSNATVSGTTTAAPGTEVNVQVRSTSGAEVPFTMTETVEVSEDGTLDATFNMSQYPAGTNFTTSVSELAPERHDAMLVSSGPASYTADFTVTGEDGEAVEGATVMVGGDELTTDANGSVSVELTEGNYTAEVSADGYQSASESFTLDADSTVEVALTPEPTEYNYDVEVVDADGNAVADATVTVDGGDYTTNADGMASVTLTEGDYTFEASADGYQSASQTVTVSDNGSVTLTLEEEQTETPTDTTTPTDNNNTTDDDDGTTESPGQPGFGVVVALVALMGAALLAYRRD